MGDHRAPPALPALFSPGPVAVTDGSWTGGGCKGYRPPDTTTCSGLARFQCTLPPTQAPPAMWGDEA
eukprot:scaffold5710_cov130-Isochrysis_galbana.AAC.3